MTRLALPFEPVLKGSAYCMVARRRRSRRRKSLSSRLRRYLIQHRFNAAQALLGVLALSSGVWLLWPAADSGGVDHRGLWQRSLQAADAAFDGRDDAFREGLVPVTESSLAVSAKRHLPGWSEPSSAEIAGKVGMVSSRMHNAVRLLRRASVYRFRMGRDLEKNAETLATFIRERIPADSSAVV